MIKSTVVIPNYNGIEYLKKCLETLFSSTDSEFDIIVVDNGSKDNSADYVRTLGDKVKLIALDKNTGFAYAVNRGIEAADTEYVILLNNDIEVEPDFVSQLELSMDKHKDAFSVNSKMVSLHNREVLDGCGDFYCALGWAYATGKGKPIKQYDKTRRIFSACGGASIYRKSILEKTGLFDEAHFAYLEDVDLGYRARINGYRNYYEPKAVCYHAGSGFSGSRYNEFKIKLASRNSVYIIYKNMPILQLILNLPFLLIGFAVKILFFVKKGFGKTYVKGLIAGFRMCAKAENKKKKVRFSFSNLINYFIIQLELWINVIRRAFS